VARGIDDASHGPVPFWVHQVVELLLGLLLLLEGARTAQDTALLVGLGAALLLLALMSDGALGAWPWISRRVHRVLDVVFAGLLALAPLVLSLDRVLPIVLIEAAAAALLWLALRTNWSPRKGGSSTRGPGADDPPARAAPAPAAPAAPATREGPTLAHRLGAATGDVTRDAPRRLGRAVGRARRRIQGPPPGP
jgi:hypothetical protein